MILLTLSQIVHMLMEVNLALQHTSTICYRFYIHGSVHRESMSITVQRDATIYSLLYWRSCGGVPTPPQQQKLANTVQPVPDAVITVYMCSR